jgi:hypothetical protein
MTPLSSWAATAAADLVLDSPGEAVKFAEFLRIVLLSRDARSAFEAFATPSNKEGPP